MFESLVVCVHMGIVIVYFTNCEAGIESHFYCVVDLQWFIAAFDFCTMYMDLAV